MAIPIKEASGVNTLQVMGVSAMPGATTEVTVLEWDSAGLVSVCKGADIPSAEAGYAVGCLFIRTSTGHIYANQGSTTSCTFDDLGAIAASEITLAHKNVLVGLSTGVAAAQATSHIIKFAGTGTYAGGGTQVALTITGVAATDVVSAVIRASTNATSIAKAVPTTNTLTVDFVADPGASTTVDYVVYRAIA